MIGSRIRGPDASALMVGPFGVGTPAAAAGCARTRPRCWRPGASTSAAPRRRRREVRSIAGIASSRSPAMTSASSAPSTGAQQAIGGLGRLQRHRASPRAFAAGCRSRWPSDAASRRPGRARAGRRAAACRAVSVCRRAGVSAHRGVTRPGLASRGGRVPCTTPPGDTGRPVRASMASRIVKP